MSISFYVIIFLPIIGEYFWLNLLLVVSLLAFNVVSAKCLCRG